jgi:hypothetical protein
MGTSITFIPFVQAGMAQLEPPEDYQGFTVRPTSRLLIPISLDGSYRMPFLQGFV